MKNRAAIFTTLLFLFVITIYAQPHTMSQNRMNVKSKLNLTEQQQDQFQKIHFDTQKKNIELNAKIATAKLELKQILSGDKQDKSTLEKKLQEIANLKVSLTMNRFNAWSDCNKVLNADQQKIWKQSLQMHLSENGNKRPMMKHNRQMMQPRGRMMQDAPVK